MVDSAVLARKLAAIRDVDVDRIFVIASNDLGDLLAFCQQLARRAGAS